ncbi:MAG: S41 family peptidase [Ferruginibacter sp.]
MNKLSRFFALIRSRKHNYNSMHTTPPLSLKSFLVFIAFSACIISCKKDNPAVETTPPAPTPITPQPATGDLLKDSALFYSKDIYLWNTQIPASFDARSYSDPDKIMQAIRQYSIEPGFSQPVDRYSFAIKKTEWDEMSAGLNWVSTINSEDGDFGLTVFFRVEGDLRVRLVEPASAAGKAGIHRGWRITAINGNTNMSTSNSDFIVDNIYSAASASVTFQKPDGSSVNITLDRTHYKEKPVYLDTVYTINNKKIGYLVFNSFLGTQSEILSDFSRVFSRFAAAGISDLVVDLRYNGGGYVSIQEKLADYLVSSSANGSLMMKQVYNSNNTGNNETTNFKKEGSINLPKIYFIVGKATASASELLINNLKPYMDVRLVGGTTYGKPVGFFPIPVGDWYIFPVSFRTTNKNGDGNYFGGITVNSQVADGLDRDWGDIKETSLASAIKNIISGSFRPTAETPYIEPVAIEAGNRKLEEPFLKMTIGEKKAF